MIDDDFKLTKKDINKRIKTLKAIIDLYQLKIWNLEKEVSELNKQKHELKKEN